MSELIVIEAAGPSQFVLTDATLGEMVIPAAPALLILQSEFGAQYPIQFQDEGVNQGAIGDVLTMNFTGSGVTATYSLGVLTVAVSGGVGGGGGAWGSITGTLSAQLDLQAALNAKAALVHTHTVSQISDLTITAANLNALDDGVNTALHFHDSDRARANHTGSQLASTISDFTEASQDVMGGLLITAGDLTWTYNDGANTLSAAVKSDVALAGNPTTTTQAANNNSTRIATTAYTDAAVSAIIAAADAMVFKGVIDCSATPNYPAADRGWTYKVSVAGKIGGAAGINVEVGDTLLCITDGTASGNQATVGAAWTIVQANLDGAVIGPASAVDGTPMVADGATGKLIKNITFAAFKTALAIAQADVAGLTTADSPQFAALNIGHASDTTLDRASAGDLRVEGNIIYRAGGTDVPLADGGTGSSTAAGAATNLGLGTGDSPQFAGVNVGHATDTTLTRPAAGQVAVEGKRIFNDGDKAIIGCTIDGGGAVITTGIKGDIGPFTFACTIEDVSLLADQSGSIVVDIWKDSYANFPPTVADTITAAAKPTISAAVKSQDATLTGWTTSIAVGDILRFNVDSITTLQRVTISMKYKRT